MLKQNCSHYWNSNGYAVAVVAVVTSQISLDGHAREIPFDWACYIGATESRITSKDDTIRSVALNGSKLSQAHAVALFPQFAEVRYRK